MAQFFSGGLVFDGRDKMLEDHGVLVEEGHIARIAPLAEFDGYAGPRTDISGCTLLPGFSDCHVHLCYEGDANPSETAGKKAPGAVSLTALRNAQTSLAAGFTALRDCGGRDYLEFAARDAIQRGEFIGPTIYGSGKIICITGGHGNRFGRVADGPDEVVKAVREQVHMGCDLIKMMATGGVMTPGVSPKDAHYTEEELRAGVTEARRFHKCTASHAQGTGGILNAVRAGVTSIEHGIYLTDEAIEEMLEAGTYLVPTLAAPINIMKHGLAAGIPAFAVEKCSELTEIHARSVRSFYQAGGKIALGTDAGTPFNRHGENGQEFSLMVDIGMKPVDALKAGCFNGADLIGLADRGLIAEERVADLIVVDGNPLDDISCVSDPTRLRAVYKDGVEVSL